MMGICENLHSFKESIGGAQFFIAEIQTLCDIATFSVIQKRDITVAGSCMLTDVQIPLSIIIQIKLSIQTAHTGEIICYQKVIQYN